MNTKITIQLRELTKIATTSLVKSCYLIIKGVIPRQSEHVHHKLANYQKFLDNLKFITFLEIRFS